VFLSLYPSRAPTVDDLSFSLSLLFRRKPTGAALQSQQRPIPNYHLYIRSITMANNKVLGTLVLLVLSFFIIGHAEEQHTHRALRKQRAYDVVYEDEQPSPRRRYYVYDDVNEESPDEYFVEEEDYEERPHRLRRYAARHHAARRYYLDNTENDQGRGR